LFLLALYGLITAANLMPVRQTSRLITAGTALKLLPLLLFVVVAALAFHLPQPSGPAGTAVTLGGLGRAMILTQFAYSGLETPLCASGEVRDPARTLPRALFLSMLFILGLYVLVQISAQHLLGPALAHASAPLAEGAARVSPVAGSILFVGAGLSMLIYLISDVLGMSRLLFAFGRDRRLPAWLGRLQPRTHVPVNAILVYVVAAFLLAMNGSFLELISQSTLAVIGVYALTCLAALRLRHRNVATLGTPLNFPGLPVAALVGLVGMGAMVASAKMVELAWLFGVGLLALGFHFVTKKGLLF
jgi:amino acid transporter